MAKKIKKDSWCDLIAHDIIPKRIVIPVKVQCRGTPKE
jgi:hypothetical protein